MNLEEAKATVGGGGEEDLSARVEAKRYDAALRDQ